MKARAKKALPLSLHSKKYIRILQMLETQLKRNRKGNPSFYHSSSYFSFMIDVIFLSFISPRYDYVILLYLHTSLLSIVP